MDDYHVFRQQNWSLNNNDPQFRPFEGKLERHLEHIEWRNYFDMHDAVSGSLDYYKDVINIDCKFKAKAGFLSFTHSDYWECDDFYKDIIHHFLQ